MVLTGAASGIRKQYSLNLARLSRHLVISAINMKRLEVEKAIKKIN